MSKACWHFLCIALFPVTLLTTCALYLIWHDKYSLMEILKTGWSAYE